MSTQTDLSILTNRRRELMSRMAEAKAVIIEAEKELALNEATGSYLAKLTGAEWPPAGEAKPAATTATGGLTAGPATVRGFAYTGPAPLTIPEMIISVLTDAAAEGFEGLAPVEIGERINKKFRVQLPKEGVSPTVWRIWKKGRLVKIREGFYALPSEKEAPDQLSLGDGSEASDPNPAQGGEARPGGGT
jgi:hypothetical protein